MSESQQTNHDNQGANKGHYQLIKTSPSSSSPFLASLGLILTSSYLLYRLTEANSLLVVSIGFGLLGLSTVLCFLKVEMNITRGRLLLSVIVHFGILATLGYFAGADWIGVGTGVLWYVCTWWLSLSQEDKTN